MLRTMIYNNITMTKPHFPKAIISQCWDLESIHTASGDYQRFFFFFTIDAEH